MTREELIDRVKEVAARLGRTTLMYKDFQRESLITDYQVKNNFDSWSALCAAAGIASERNFRLDDGTVLAALRDAVMAHGGVDTMQQIGRHFRYNSDSWRSRWQDSLGALRALRDWVLVNDPGFPHRPRPRQLARAQVAESSGGKLGVRGASLRARRNVSRLDARIASGAASRWGGRSVLAA